MHFVWTSYFIACLLALYILIFFFPKPENFNECHFLSLMQYIMLRIHTYNRASVRWNTENVKEESLSIRIACDMKHLPKIFFSFFYYITFFSQAYARFLKWREDFFYCMQFAEISLINFYDSLEGNFLAHKCYILQLLGLIWAYNRATLKNLISSLQIKAK